MTKPTPATLIVHDAALLFPEMLPDEFAEFKDDIQRNGLREPILTNADGRIVDGRHRLRACEELGIEPLFDTVQISDDEIPDWVVSRNLHRRHLTTSQRAMIAAELANLKQGGRQPADLPVAVSQSDAAKRLGVSERSARTATQVKKRAPQLVKPVKEKRLSLNAAAEIAALPDQERDEAILQVKSGDIAGALDKTKIKTSKTKRSATTLPADYAAIFLALDELPTVLSRTPPKPIVIEQLDVALRKAVELIGGLSVASREDLGEME